jgi:hypothetical protein
MNEKLQEAMFNFQYLELMLREALKTFESLIEFKMKGILNYQVDDLAIDKLALGRLSNQFAKYTNNKGFSSEVEKVIKARNQLAHRLFISVELHQSTLPNEIDKDVEDAILNGETAARLGDEVFALMQNYYFDPVAQEWRFPG